MACSRPRRRCRALSRHSRKRQGEVMSVSEMARNEVNAAVGGGNLPADGTGGALGCLQHFIPQVRPHGLPPHWPLRPGFSARLGVSIPAESLGSCRGPWNPRRPLPSQFWPVGLAPSRHFPSGKRAPSRPSLAFSRHGPSTQRGPGQAGDTPGRRARAGAVLCTLWRLPLSPMPVFEPL